MSCVCYSAGGRSWDISHHVLWYSKALLVAMAKMVVMASKLKESQVTSSDYHGEAASLYLESISSMFLFNEFENFLTECSFWKDFTSQ